MKEQIAVFCSCFEPNHYLRVMRDAEGYFFLHTGYLGHSLWERIKGAVAILLGRDWDWYEIVIPDQEADRLLHFLDSSLEYMHKSSFVNSAIYQSINEQLSGRKLDA